MRNTRRFAPGPGPPEEGRSAAQSELPHDAMEIMIQPGGSVAGAERSAVPGDKAEGWIGSRPQWRAVLTWSLCVTAAFLCCLRLGSTRAVDSDGAAQALQAWDMLHGNLLLGGWALSDVSFYTTELPQYVAVELVRGLGADVVTVAAATTYTLVLLLAALLAKGTATGASAVARVLITTGIMIAPQASAGVKIFISSPDHIGTTVPVLLAWLILDRAPRRWFVPVIAVVVLGWAAVADTLVLYIGLLPVVLVCLVRIGRAMVASRAPLRSQWYEVTLGAGALVAAALARAVVHAIKAAGGFVVQAPVAHVHGVSALPHALDVTGQGLLLLAGADFLGAGPASAETAFLWLHLAGAAAASLGVLVAMGRYLRDRGLVDQILVAAIVINLAAYVFSTQSASILTSREIVAVLPFSAVLAGRMLADRVLAIRAVPIVLLVVLAGYLGGLGYGMAQPSAPAANQQLASWLEAHHLRSGLAGYWQANVVTLASGDRIQLRPITTAGALVVPYLWESSSRWYDPRQGSANFVVLTAGTPEYPGFDEVTAVLATFGEPARGYRVGAYLVLVWQRNLLRSLRT
jgi:hypothetical protein